MRRRARRERSGYRACGTTLACLDELLIAEAQLVGAPVGLTCEKARQFVPDILELAQPSLHSLELSPESPDDRLG